MNQRTYPSNIEIVWDIIGKFATRVQPQDEDGFEVCDYAPGNIDDAYHLGVDWGMTLLAREIIDLEKALKEEEE